MDEGGDGWMSDMKDVEGKFRRPHGVQVVSEDVCPFHNIWICKITHGRTI